MLQAKMVDPGKIVFEDVKIPEFNNKEVLIKVKRIGICGSDIHVYYGEHPYTSYPVIQGHELSGEIVNVGNDVKTLKIGDMVVVQPQVVCGKCYPCQNGNYHICNNLKVMGFQTDGWAREYFKADETKVLKIPREMNYDEGALVEPLAVACHALKRSNVNLKNKNIVVIGAGTIGNLVAQSAKAQGANVLITDISDYRLEKAKKCDVDYTVNVKNNTLQEAILTHFGSDKADLILECVGSEHTINQAINNARKGSKIIVVGVYSDKVNVDLGFVQDRELKLIGTLMYKKADYIDAINLIATHQISSDEIITNHFSFRDYDKAYKYIEKQKDKVMKVMIDVDL